MRTEAVKSAFEKAQCVGFDGDARIGLIGFHNAARVLARYAESWEMLWYDEFAINGLCGLCANTGIIETNACSPAGVQVNGKFNCICPNGRSRVALGLRPDQR